MANYGFKHHLRTVRVLHLEDSDLDAELVKDRLERSGLNIAFERATDRGSFVARLQQQRYDLILSDFQVPTFDGLNALELAREHQPQTPFIFVSGAMGEDLAVETLKQGAVDYVLKDRLVRLPQAVERALRENLERNERKRAEKTVEEALTLLEGIAEGTEELIVAIDHDYRFTVVNRAYAREFQRVFGTRAEVGESLLDALAHLPEEQAHAKSLWGRALGGERLAVTADFGDPTRERRTFDLRFYPIRDAAGRVVGAGEIASDVTERAREERRQRFYTELAVATQPLTDPEAVTATTARLLAEHLEVDRCAYADVEDESVFVVLGDYTRGVPSIVGRWRLNAFGSQLRDKLLAGEPFVVEDIESDPAFREEDRGKYRQGVVRAMICVPLFKEGRLHSAMAVQQNRPRRWTAAEIELVQNVVGNCWETLERARAVRQLRASEERFRTLVITTSPIIWTANADGEMVGDNPSWAAFTGQTPAEYTGWGWLDALHPHDREPTATIWRQAVEKQQRYETEYQLRRHDGEYRRIIARGAPVFADDGSLREWIGNCSDVTDRLRAEEGLARVTTESEQRRRLYETILSNTPDLAYVFSLDHRISYANEVLLQMWGRTWEEAIGKTLLEIGYEPWHAEMHSREIEQVVATKQPIRGEVPFTGTFGRRFYDYIFVPVIGADGEVEAVAGTTRDVTERKQQEEELAERERRYRMVADAAKDAIWDWDLVNNEVDWNEGVRTNFGYPMEEVESDPSWWSDRIHPEDAERITHAIHRHIREGGPDQRSANERSTGRHADTWHGEYRFRRADGTYAYVFDRGRVVRDAEGRATRMVGSMLDLTERRQAEQNLARLLAEAKRHAAVLNRVASASRSMNAVLSAESIARIVTDEACSILDAQGGVTTFVGAEDCHQRIAAFPSGRANYEGPSSAADSNLATARLGHPSGACSDGDADAEESDSGEAGSCTSGAGQSGAGQSGAAEFDEELALKVCEEERPIRVPAAAGSGGWARLAVPLVGHSGRILGVSQLMGSRTGDFTAEDESVLVQLAAIAAAGIENSRLYEQVREQDRRKDEFLATLAHELRNPLAPIRTGLAVLAMTPAGEPQPTEILEVMERQVGHMVRLIDDLLDVSRITRGTVQLKQERIAVQEVFEAAIEVSRSTIEHAEHRLTVSAPDQPLMIDADPTRMAQVVSNLLNNAAKYTPSGGQITLSAESEGKEVVIRVQDNGEGISAEMLSRVFEMFTQVGQTLGRAQGGLGIGLALVSRLVEMHGGTVSAESPGLGKGSTFVVRLPLAASEPAGEGDGHLCTDPVMAAAITRRILVVDDNTDGARVLSMLLENAGHTTATAYTGPAALEAADQFRPEVVFLDIGLPGMNGYEVAQRLRGSSAADGLILVALTGWGTDNDRQRAKEAGFDHHLTKPVDAAHLESLLAQLSNGGIG
ncbi:PAS domain S-box protein [Candidatus Laterigemmans baculatus]|uniref:PAS domain S-box protein n=1 Tax=Candidatus Laterigemmans baculatus TaxID=2770505 RepID=UPI0013DC2D44|nr:PAS domain S-box protein [Candidatus Laterigemmans baculatus]